MGRGGGIRVVPVRDSKVLEGPVLRFSQGAWALFVAFAAGCEV
ncbi:DUF397 domain-containing protein [Streptomyces varsoviensis]